MAIRERDVSYVAVRELLAHDLRIPHYQRPYSWEPPTALQLLRDIVESHKSTPNRPYVLGAVILYRPEGQDWREVVDGQQRLLTLTIILQAINATTGHAAPPASASRSDTGPTVVRTRAALTREVERIRARGDGDALAAFINDACRVVKVETDDLDEAFRVFDSQNYRGKPLKPHDLLKAYHLREMGAESDNMRATVVEGWESVDDDDLDRLFSTYLYRIRRWSRGESAPGFSIRDIEMFKGITRRDIESPTSRYHRAAQASLPLLEAWASTGKARSRDENRSRFQLDAPVVAGRTFFEMVSFMLRELAAVRQDAFPDELDKFASCETTLHERPGRAPFRYATELFLAALFYYTNKFSDDDFDAARDKLFTWAFNLRLRYQRVQFRSVDNHARSMDQPISVFPLLRNAASGQALRQLLVTAEPPATDGHYEDLAEVLKGLAES